MPASRGLPPGAGACLRAAAALLAASLSLGGCAPTTRDRVVRQDVETLQTDVHQVESALQARVAGANEQIREVREEQARLEGLLEENRRLLKSLGQRVDLLRDRTQEDFARRDKALEEGAQTVGGQLARLGERLDLLGKDVRTVNDNLVAMSGFEKKQEERITKIQEQLQSQIKVVVEEVGRENQSLAKDLAAVRGDVERVGRESEGVRDGLVQLQQALEKIAERLAAVQGDVRDLSRRQESARRAPASAGQHTVKAGETLTGIAARYGVGVQALMESNNIADPDSLREGQRLSIPRQ